VLIPDYLLPRTFVTPAAFCYRCTVSRYAFSTTRPPAHVLPVTFYVGYCLPVYYLHTVRCRVYLRTFVLPPLPFCRLPHTALPLRSTRLRVTVTPAVGYVPFVAGLRSRSSHVAFVHHVTDFRCYAPPALPRLRFTFTFGALHALRAAYALQFVDWITRVPYGCSALRCVPVSAVCSTRYALYYRGYTAVLPLPTTLRRFVCRLLPLPPDS